MNPSWDSSESNTSSLPHSEALRQQERVFVLESTTTTTSLLSSTTLSPRQQHQQQIRGKELHDASTIGGPAVGIVDVLDNGDNDDDHNNNSTERVRLRFPLHRYHLYHAEANKQARKLQQTEQPEHLEQPEQPEQPQQLSSDHHHPSSSRRNDELFLSPNTAIEKGKASLTCCASSSSSYENYEASAAALAAAAALMDEGDDDDDDVTQRDSARVAEIWNAVQSIQSPFARTKAYWHLCYGSQLSDVVPIDSISARKPLPSKSCLSSLRLLPQDRQAQSSTATSTTHSVTIAFAPTSALEFEEDVPVNELLFNKSCNRCNYGSARLSFEDFGDIVPTEDSIDFSILGPSTAGGASSRKRQQQRRENFYLSPRSTSSHSMNSSNSLDMSGSFSLDSSATPLTRLSETFCMDSQDALDCFENSLHLSSLLEESPASTHALEESSASESTCDNGQSQSASNQSQHGNSSGSFKFK